MSESFIKYANSFQTVVNLGLGRIAALLELMGNPQNALRCIHVGGTNGKGSVCAFLESILTNAGYKVGRYTSPNLIKVNERICVNGKQIPDAELRALLERIGALCPKAEEQAGECPSQFEVWTAAAFEYFKRQGCDIVLLEVGLGGEFDATNVISSNVAAIITRVDLDHCALLGDTAEEIALTKCGIIKDGSLTVTVKQKKGVNDVISRCAEQKKNRLITAAALKSTGFSGINEKFMYSGRELVCGLGGAHQLENATIAIAAAEALGIDSESIAAGIETAVHRARMEKLAHELIFDGAHNPNGVEALVKNLERYFPGREQTIIFACMKDKDILPSLKLLKAENRHFIFTEVANNPRTMGAKELCELAASAGIGGEWRPDLASALALAARLGRLTVICGSLYLYETVPEAVKEWTSKNS